MHISETEIAAVVAVGELLVVETIARLRDCGFKDVRELVTAEEHVVFPLPRDLREATAG